jgi:hypothetical protein
MEVVDLDASDSFELELFHPVTTAPLGMFVKISGPNSDEFKRVLNEQSRRRSNSMIKRASIAPLVPTIDEIEANKVELLAACTLSWRTVKGEESFDRLMIKGIEDLACNAANAATVYRKFPWLRGQVDTEMNTTANFIKG